MFKLLVLISGSGSNLQYLIDNLHNKTIYIGNNVKETFKIVGVISNKSDAFGLIRASQAKIPTSILKFNREKHNREDYDTILADYISKIDYDLIVCAGWMRILSTDFLNIHSNIINLHPALPGKYPGAHAIEDAYQDFLAGKIDSTGCMVHWVIPEIDAGDVISTRQVKLLPNMNFIDCRRVVQFKEKMCLLEAILKVSILHQMILNNNIDTNPNTSISSNITTTINPTVIENLRTNNTFNTNNIQDTNITKDIDNTNGTNRVKFTNLDNTNKKKINYQIYDLQNILEFNNLKVIIECYLNNNKIYHPKMSQSATSQFTNPMDKDIVNLFDVEPGYIGKVRQIFHVNNQLDMSDNPFLILHHSDRCSAFNKHQCDIKNKGLILCETAAWWLKNSRHIIDNHYLHHKGPNLLAKKCRPIKLEVIVRQYMTGSLYQKYQNGCRSYCGVTFPHGLSNNQKLPEAVITPTLKNENDDPTSEAEILASNTLKPEEWNFIKEKAMELFRFGQFVAENNNLILVDTKYEFGYDCDGNIILIDEVHTGDSSRYWIADTYQSKFNKGESPDKLDKDAVRDYLKANPESTEIPEEVQNKVIDSYLDLYGRFTGLQVSNNDINLANAFGLQNVAIGDSLSEFINLNRTYPRIFIVAGSTSDKPFVDKIVNCLDNSSKILCHTIYSSAHKETMKVVNLINRVDSNYDNVVWITVAGRSNALSGVVAANSKFPVIACPPFKDKMDMMTNINSSLQCPSKVPVMTIIEPSNAIISCLRIFNMRR